MSYSQHGVSVAVGVVVRTCVVVVVFAIGQKGVSHVVTHSTNSPLMAVPHPSARHCSKSPYAPHTGRA